MSLLDILKQYVDPSTPPTGDVAGHFDQVAEQAPTADVARGVAAAFRDDSTPSFGQSVGDLFNRSNPQQQAGVLNELVRGLPAGALTGLAGGILGKIFGNAPASPGALPPITPAQASQVTPADVTAIANHAETADGSIVDKVSAFYAQHPTLVKSMGAAALAIALGHMRSQT